jgi:hypothetical protein
VICPPRPESSNLVVSMLELWRWPAPLLFFGDEDMATLKEEDRLREKTERDAKRGQAQSASLEAFRHASFKS